MPRQTISFTEPNADWLKEQVQEKEYVSITEIVNDLVRRARRDEEARVEKIRALLIEGEESIAARGYSEISLEDIKQNVLKRKGRDAGL